MNEYTYNFNRNNYVGIRIKNINSMDLASIIVKAINYNYNIDFYNFSILKNQMNSLEIIRNIMKYIAIFSLIISIIWILYIGHFRNRISSLFFKTLNIQGLNKASINYILFQNSIYIFIIASVLGSLFGIFLCNIISKLFNNLGDIDLKFNIYNPLSSLIGIIICFISIIIFSFLEYIISNNGKKKSHIVE